MLKGKPKTETDGAAQANQQPQFKENPQVNAKIDDYIKNNPKFWDYVQSMSPERMGRALVLGQIQKQDRTEKMQAGILRKLDENPEMKQSIQAMVKNMPEEQRERAMVSIARQTMRATAPKQAPATAGVKV
ncbi:MAG: hypothetical protein ABI680_16545 [Chthoniobacteraceae bacterium]